MLALCKVMLEFVESCVEASCLHSHSVIVAKILSNQWVMCRLIYVRYCLIFLCYLCVWLRMINFVGV